MATWDDLPIELIYEIVDYLDADDHLNECNNTLDIIYLSQVNRLLNEMLWQDPSFYERLCRRHISVNLSNVPLVELRRMYYQGSHQLWSIKDDYERLQFVVKRGWSHVFNSLFQPSNFTPEKDDKYYKAIKQREREEHRHDNVADRPDDGDNSDDDDDDDIDDEERHCRINVLLDLAVEHGHVSIMDKLLDSGANMCYWWGVTLCRSIIHNQIHIFNRLIERDPTIIHKRSPIITASGYNRLEMVNRLVELGVNVTVDQNHAIRSALENQHIEVAKRLLELGASIPEHYPPWILYTAERGLIHTMKFLATPAEKDSNIYHQALVLASRHGRTEIVDYLLTIGVDPQAPKGNGRPLFVASERGYLEIVNRFLKEKIPFSTIGTACCGAIRNNHMAVVQRFLELDLDANAINQIYCVATQKRNLVVLKRLNPQGKLGIPVILEKCKLKRMSKEQYKQTQK